MLIYMRKYSNILTKKAIGKISNKKIKAVSTFVRQPFFICSGIQPSVIRTRIRNRDIFIARCIQYEKTEPIPCEDGFGFSYPKSWVILLSDKPKCSFKFSFKIQTTIYRIKSITKFITSIHNNFIIFYCSIK